MYRPFRFRKVLFGTSYPEAHPQMRFAEGYAIR
jgi:hypothetical protein